MYVRITWARFGGFISLFFSHIILVLGIIEGNLKMVGGDIRGSAVKKSDVPTENVHLRFNPVIVSFSSLLHPRIV